MFDAYLIAVTSEKLKDTRIATWAKNAQAQNESQTRFAPSCPLSTDLRRYVFVEN
jgi:hypothetical protein